MRKNERRNFLSAGLSSAAALLAARPSQAASLSDWMAGAGVAYRFGAAGIPAHSYTMSSTSMLPTVLAQDVLLADLRAQGKLPERGEIIVFNTAGAAVWIKRVIGLPGDRIAFKGGRPILNGAEIAWEDAGSTTVETDSGRQAFSLRQETLPGREPYRIALKPGGARETQFCADSPETVVASNRLYVVGDNRCNSMDSRFPGMRPVSLNDVVGRIVYRLRPNPDWLVSPQTVPGLPAE